MVFVLSTWDCDFSEIISDDFTVISSEFSVNAFGDISFGYEVYEDYGECYYVSQEELVPPPGSTIWVSSEISIAALKRIKEVYKVNFYEFRRGYHCEQDSLTVFYP